MESESRELAATGALPSKEDWRRSVGSVFGLTLENGRSTQIQLTSMTEHGISRGVDQFSLCFAAPPGETVGQGSYPIHHPSLGNFELFLVPIGRTEQGTVLEAVFALMSPEV